MTLMPTTAKPSGGAIDPSIAARARSLETHLLLAVETSAGRRHGSNRMTESRSGIGASAPAMRAGTTQL